MMFVCDGVLLATVLALDLNLVINFKQASLNRSYIGFRNTA